ncbi:Nn.00g017150.m01.CDS01 [Neocucurbitaria sp. VM-36]
MACRKKGKTATQSSEPSSMSHENELAFPFLQLPGEIRNMIYECTLVDHHYSIRIEVIVSNCDRRYILRRLYRARPGPPDRDDLPNQQRPSLNKAYNSWKQEETFRQFSFARTLLQTCHQINEEAAPFFYGNNIFLSYAVPRLYAFLEQCSHRLPLLRKLGFAPTVDHRSFKTSFQGPKSLHDKKYPYLSVFPLLTGAMTIEKLYIHASVWKSLSRLPHRAAKEFFMKAYDWLVATWVRERDPLTVLELPAITAKRLKCPHWSTSKQGQDDFLTELSRLMKITFDYGNWTTLEGDE